MMSPLHTRLVTWLLLALVALMGITPPSGLALCVGRDGHVELGVIDLGRMGLEQECPCDSSPQPAHEPGDEHEKELGQEEHSGCGDLQLTALPMQQRIDEDASSRLPDTRSIALVAPQLTWTVLSTDDGLALSRAWSLNERGMRPPCPWLCELRSNVLTL